MSRGITASVVGRDPGPVWLCELQRPARSPPPEVSLPNAAIGLTRRLPPFPSQFIPSQGGKRRAERQFMEPGEQLAKVRLAKQVIQP